MNQSRNLALMVGILVLTAVAFFTLVYIPGKGYQGKLGLDLRSGSRIVVELLPPIDKPDLEIDEGVMTRTRQVFERRLNPAGNKEIIINSQGLKRIEIELPEETNLSRAEEQVKKVGRLDFREEKIDPVSGQEHWVVAMSGEFIKEASYQFSNSEPYITFTLTDEGKTRFGELTTRLVGRPLGIFFDGTKIDAPNVQEPITGGEGRISGGSMKEEDAKELANYLNAGALPVRINLLASSVVSATLGQDALNRSLLAGGLGLGLVMLFMVFYYRVPGLLADIALMVYSVLCLATMVVMGAALTLPGIAGFILSIGMAVDANVLIFERLKEELWKDKSVRSATDLGFQRAFSSILDGHVTTFIGALILYLVATGSLKGFGNTLMIGTAWSMITAVLITRVFMDVTVQSGVATSRTAYGA
ncbi:MAG TPA: protein translocase subunit SecD [Candidatus Xenobia bacterium]|jgi:preprotein translocase subunit SecD